MTPPLFKHEHFQVVMLNVFHLFNCLQLYPRIKPRQRSLA